MRSLVLLLKLVAPVFLIVGALHLLLGLGADALLGAKVSAEVMTDPALDSQNRFYGVAFTLYGVLLFLCSTDIAKIRNRASLRFVGILCCWCSAFCFNRAPWVSPTNDLVPSRR